MAFVRVYVLLFNFCLIYCVYSIHVENIKLRIKNRVSTRALYILFIFQLGFFGL
jgi:hypothetical protein